MALTNLNFILCRAKERKVIFKKILSVLLLLLVLGMAAKSACSSLLNLSDSDSNNPDTDFFFSYTNLSLDEVMNWREKVPNVSYIYPHTDKCLRYSAVFFPGLKCINS